MMREHCRSPIKNKNIRKCLMLADLYQRCPNDVNILHKTTHIICNAGQVWAGLGRFGQVCFPEGTNKEGHTCENQSRDDYTHNESQAEGTSLEIFPSVIRQSYMSAKQERLFEDWKRKEAGICPLGIPVQSLLEITRQMNN